eukprot:357255-Chlamydomonas_euryale.AAC.5
MDLDMSDKMDSDISDEMDSDMSDKMDLDMSHKVDSGMSGALAHNAQTLGRTMLSETAPPHTTPPCAGAAGCGRRGQPVSYVRAGVRAEMQRAWHLGGESGRTCKHVRAALI